MRAGFSGRLCDNSNVQVIVVVGSLSDRIIGSINSGARRVARAQRLPDEVPVFLLHRERDVGVLSFVRGWKEEEGPGMLTRRTRASVDTRSKNKMIMEK